MTIDVKNLVWGNLLFDTRFRPTQDYHLLPSGMTKNLVLAYLNYTFPDQVKGKLNTVIARLKALERDREVAKSTNNQAALLILRAEKRLLKRKRYCLRVFLTRGKKLTPEKLEAIKRSVISK